MAKIDIFAWIVLVIIVVSVVVVFVQLAMLPGKVAKSRNHPQAEAINAAGWLGLILSAGLFWAVALVWALYKPVGEASQFGNLDEPDARNANLKAKTSSEGGGNS